MTNPVPDLSLEYAKKALPLMNRYKIGPTPINYAVWYHYVEGKNQSLMQEIDKVIAQGVGFTDDINHYLYNRYIVEDLQRKVMEDAQVGAQAVLSQILQVMSEFHGQTSQHGAEVDRHIGALSQQFDSGSVELMVKEILSSAKTLKESSTQLNNKLEESRAEIESLKENLVQVSHEAQRDFLTGAANRKALEKELEEQMQVASEQKTDLSLLMLDIDHFKQFNDRFGHLIGDEVLKIVARALTDSVRGKDMVARYGGEEFSVLLPGTPIGGAMIVAESIRKTIASRDLKRKDTGESFGAITVSIGVSLYRPESDTIPLFMKRADEALYRSKKSGRNRVTQESL